MTLQVEPEWTPPPGSPPDYAPRVRGLGEFTSWMKSRPRGHHHTSHRGLLPTLPMPYWRLASHWEAMLGESTLKRSLTPRTTETWIQQSTTSSPRQPQCQGGPSEGVETEGHGRAGNPAPPPGEGTHLSQTTPAPRWGHSNTSSPMLASGSGDPHGGQAVHQVDGYTAQETSPQTQSQSPRLLAVILEMNGMQEGQRTGEHMWRQKHVPLTFSIHVPGPGRWLPCSSPELGASCGGHCLQAGLEPRITNRKSSYRFILGTVSTRVLS